MNAWVERKRRRVDRPVETGIGCSWTAIAAIGLALLIAGQAAAQAPGLGASVELVDPKVFRVCADPRNLPFSDEAGEGFENRLAELFARKLGEPASYTYFPQVIGFVRNTLNALRCDVIMGVAVGDDLVQTTNPYYHTTYALVFKPGSGFDGIESLEDRGSRAGISVSLPARRRPRCSCSRV